MVLAFAVIFGARASEANWLTQVVREAGEAGEAASIVTKLGPVGKALASLIELKGAPKGALAAHATPEGHWQFANRDGDTFTVGTQEEMARVLPTLAPDALAEGKGKLTLYLSEDSVFANRDALQQIPGDADLFVVTDSGVFPITLAGRGSELVLAARLKPHLVTTLVDKALFEEMAFLLGRPLNKANIRTIAFEPGAGKSLSSAPKLEAGSQVPLVDRLDPAFVYEGFRAIRGQTALVTGRAEGGKLIIASPSGAETALVVDDLVEAARRNDVNLVLLQSDTSRQAGGRNWLWQKVEVDGLKAAGDSATLGDFVDGLAARRGGFKLTASGTGERVHISALSESVGIAHAASNAVEDLVSHVTGELITKAVEIDARDESTEKERGARLIPWVPTYIQYPYLAGLVAGLAGLATARRWWMRLIPASRPDGPAKRAGRLRRLPVDLAFVLLFLPAAGLPAFLVHSIVQLAEAIIAPFRWIRRKFLLSRV